MLEYLRTRFDGHRTYAVTEEDQARGLARTYLIAATVPWIERVYFFHLHQEAAYTDVNEQVDYYMGLFTPWRKGQIRPKDAYFAVKTVIELLSGSTYQDRIETPPRVWALHFERGDEATIALWSLDDGVVMKSDDLSAVTSITSMVGTPVLITKDSLTLSGRPLYLKTDRVITDRIVQQIRTQSGTGPLRSSPREKFSRRDYCLVLAASQSQSLHPRAQFHSTSRHRMTTSYTSSGYSPFISLHSI